MKGAHLLLTVNTSTCWKNGAPPDKINLGVLYCLLYGVPWFQQQGSMF